MSTESFRGSSCSSFCVRRTRLTTAAAVMERPPPPPPLTAADGWGTGRFRGRSGKRRFFYEIGGGCRCLCRRPGNAHHAEAADATLLAYTNRMGNLALAGQAHCQCEACGEWMAGPLRPGEQRRIFGCCNLVNPAWDRFCEQCGLNFVRWPSGLRTMLGSG